MDQRAAAEHIEDGDVAIISGGTTTAQMIPHLAQRQELTIITNALNIASLLASYPNISVIVLGGARHSRALCLDLSPRMR